LIGLFGVDIDLIDFDLMDSKSLFIKAETAHTRYFLLRRIDANIAFSVLQCFFMALELFQSFYFARE